MLVREQNLNHKLVALRTMLDDKGFAALEISSQANFSWLTRGRGFIGLASVLSCGSIIITRQKAYLVADNIEAQRLYTEQLGESPQLETVEFPWNQPKKRADIVKNIVGGGRLATESELAHQLFEMRAVMTEWDIADYRALCKEAAQILEDVVSGLSLGVSGHEVVGEISKRFWSRGIEPITMLCAFDGRALKYRHPIPHAETLENYALVAICGRRGGLIVSATRNLLLREDAGMIAHHTKCAMVDAAATAQLIPGRVLGDIYNRMVAEYARQGHPGEETFHHQGGLTGFVPRELRAVPGCSHVVRRNEVYAFNPSLQGAKCEDTILVANTGPQVMTHTGEYAYISCQIDGQEILKPTVLVKG